MATVDRYIDQVLARIWASEERRKRLEADLRAHFEQGLADGETDAAVMRRLGTAEEVAEAFMADVELDFAGFWERAFAFVADAGALFSLSIPIVLLGALIGRGLESIDSSWASIGLIGVLVPFGLGLVGLYIFYFPVLEHRFGKTLRKHLMGIRVRNESGGELSLGAAFIRRLSLDFEILMLDSLFVPFTAKKQRAFDIVAKTIVVREPDAARGAVRYLSCILPWLPEVLVAVLVAVRALGPASP